MLKLISYPVKHLGFLVSGIGFAISILGQIIEDLFLTELAEIKIKQRSYKNLIKDRRDISFIEKYLKF